MASIPAMANNRKPYAKLVEEAVVSVDQQLDVEEDGVSSAGIYSHPNRINEPLDVNDSANDASVIGNLVTNLLKDESGESGEEEEDDIWSGNNDNLVSDYLSLIKAHKDNPNVDFSKSVIRLDKRYNVMKHMVMSMNWKDVEWIKKNFNCRECVQFVYNPDTRLCFCGREQSDHAKSDTEHAVWRTELLPTNALGRVLFSEDDHFASRYIRVAENTSQDAIFRLFKQKWKVNTPGMVISTIGSLESFTITKELKGLIKDGIVKAVTKTTGWILTEGLDTGFVKLMGEACHQYGYPFPCIGITNWGKLRDAKKLETKHSMLLRVKRIEYEDPADSDMNRLETHHTHFVLVDDGTVSGKTNSEAKFRAKFEQYISDTLKTPIVVVLLQGGLISLRKVLTYLKRNIPIISVPDSGGMAGLLKYFLDHLTAKEGEIVLAEQVEEDSTGSCRCGTHSGLLASCPDLEHGTKSAFPGYGETEVEECLDLFAQVVEYRNLVTFYNKTAPFDAVILDSLLHKDTYSLRSQLDLALRWDRLDVAADILKKHDNDIRLQESQDALSLTLFNAVVNDRPNFVEFLLNGGGDINLSQANIENIFSDSPPPHFVRLLEKHTEYEVGEAHHISLLHINQLLDYIFGNWYNASTGYESDPYYEFMILNCVLLRKEMAMIMWSRVEEPVKAALAACLLLHGLKHCSGYAIGSDEKLALKDLYQTFEQAAVGTINVAYKEDPRVCIIDLPVRWKRFKNVSQLNLAWGAFSRKFLATRPVQEIIKRNWRGDIRKSVASWKSFAVSMFPILLVFPRLIPFRLDVMYTDSKGKETRKPLDGFVQRITAFYSSPVIKFQNHALWYVLFLVLHTFVLLESFGPRSKQRDINPATVLLIVTVFLYIIEELRQWAISGVGFRGSYLENYWNRLDITMYSLYTLGILLWLIDGNYCYDTSRALMSLNTLLLFIRLLFLSYVDHNMGTLLHILIGMSRDFINILFLMLIFIVGYGVALIALVVEPENFVSGNLVAMFFYPYFQLFGELNLDHLINYTTTVNDTETPLYLSGDTSRTDASRVMSIILVAVYMLIVVIGFVNLLIAMFSDTYSRIKDMQLDVMKYMRYALCEEYESAIMPPPIYTPIVYLIYILRCVYSCCCSCGCVARRDGEKAKNDERILTWKRNVLKSLMKESSIVYYQQYLSAANSNSHGDETYSRHFRDTMNDVTDRIAQLDLQTKWIKHKQITVKPKDKTHIRFKNKSEAEVASSSTKNKGGYLSKYINMPKPSNSKDRKKRPGNDENEQYV